MAARLRLYGDSMSGNCYKICLLCSELAIDYEWREVDILAGETRTDEFLAMNPNGKIPLLITENGACLPESNAILCYLADGTDLAGTTRLARAQVLSWMFFEQYSHEPNIATSRFVIKYLGNPPERQDALRDWKKRGYQALDVMERQLTAHDYMAGDAYSLADIALFAYTQVADEGGFDLAAYPGVNAWLDRVRARPRFTAMRVRAS